jgi:hypothetical protein
MELSFTVGSFSGLYNVRVRDLETCILELAA